MIVPRISPVYFDARAKRWTITVHYGERIDNHREHSEAEAKRVRAILSANARTTILRDAGLR